MGLIRRHKIGSIVLGLLLLFILTVFLWPPVGIPIGIAIMILIWIITDTGAEL